MVFLKDFFQKVNFEKNQQTTKNMKNYQVCNELMCVSVLSSPYEHVDIIDFGQRFGKDLVLQVICMLLILVVSHLSRVEKTCFLHMRKQRRRSAAQ